METALAGVTGVRLAAAAVREDRPGDQRLAGYVVPEAGAVVDPAVVRNAVRGILPGLYGAVSGRGTGELPLGRTGSWTGGRCRHQNSVLRGRRAAEGRRVLGRSCCASCLPAQVLDVDRVGVEDSFFDLGGHSLLATVLLAQLAGRFGVEMPLKRFFSDPFVRAVNEYLDEAQGRAYLSAARHSPVLRPVIDFG